MGQSGSPLDLGSRCRRFESFYPDQTGKRRIRRVNLDEDKTIVASSLYPQEFLDAVNDLIDNWEGTKCTNTEHDRGGMTKYGISQASHPKLAIATLTRPQATDIYYKEYWPQSKDIKNPQLRAKVFNMGVLMGPVTAVRLAFGCNNISEYRLVCKRHYEAIVINHPDQVKFLPGWTRRALA
jgi:hypothetical protein